MSLLANLSNDEFINIVKQSYSYAEIVRKCGFSNVSGASENIIKNKINELNLDISHFQKFCEKRKWTPEEIFIKNSPVHQTTLRRYYITGAYSPYNCSICGLEPFWNGKELTLTLDHINGINNDDRLENLRWVCPNCDRQLDTFAGKNLKQHQKLENFCVDCGTLITQEAKRCPKCSAKYNALQRRTVERPDRETLKQLIRTVSFVQLGKNFGVSDKAITKWCKAENLPHRKTDINSYTDEEWLLL